MAAFVSTLTVSIAHATSEKERVTSARQAGQLESFTERGGCAERSNDPSSDNYKRRSGTKFRILMVTGADQIFNRTNSPTS